MKKTELIMGMPITVEVVESGLITSAPYDRAAFGADEDGGFSDYGKAIAEVMDFFRAVDAKFSTYKTDSEISLINRGLIEKDKYSPAMREIFDMAEETKRLTDGYFDIVNRQGLIDPSGIVKGWAIFRASKILDRHGLANHYVEAGGDIQTRGLNGSGKKWRVGIRDPFNRTEIVKVLALSGQGVATSGTYIRGQHIYNPKKKTEKIEEIVSLTVVGPDIYEADRMATAAFAMGSKGIEFIEKYSGLEGYMIDRNGIATLTGGFERYVRSE